MDWLRTTGRRWLPGVAAGLLVALLFLSGLLEGVERWGLNQQFGWRGPIKPMTPIVIVIIDEDSFDKLGLQWPFPRALHGKFLDFVSRGKPAAIGFDLLFPEVSRLGEVDDRAFADALGRAGNVVLAAAFAETRPDSGVLIENFLVPIPIIGEKAAGFGFVNIPPDRDAFLRRVSLIREFQGTSLTSFTYELYGLAVKAGVPAQPLPHETTFLINYQGGARTFKTIPYYSVVNGDVSPDIFKGKIVLLGLASPVNHNAFLTPFATNGNMPGVEIHANVLENLFQGIALRKAPKQISLALILLATLLSTWLTNRFQPTTSLTMILGGAVGYVAVVFAAFKWGLVCVDLAPVPLALAFCFIATIMARPYGATPPGY